MFGFDFSFTKRCYDLKGSVLGRNTKTNLWKQMTGGTGLKVLKENNLIVLNKKRKVVDIDEIEKMKLTKILKKDSELLSKHALIDYSLFLIEVDRREKEKAGNKHSLQTLSVVYDKKQKTYVVREVEIP